MMGITSFHESQLLLLGILGILAIMIVIPYDQPVRAAGCWQALRGQAHWVSL